MVSHDHSLSFWLSTAIVLLLPAAVLPGPLAASQNAQAKPDRLWVYIGTYTQGGSKGIYRLELDLSSGKFSSPQLAAQLVNPSFLAIHPNQRFLYAVGEVGEFGGKKTGAVSA